MSARLALGGAIGCALLAAGCVTTSNDSGQGSPQAAGQANLQLGAAYLQQGNLPIAKEKLERAEKQAPRDPQVHGLLAMLYHRLGEDQKAEKEWRTALDLAPNDPEQLNNYAVFLCSLGRVDEGVSRFLEAARNPLYRTPWAAYTNAGVCLRGANRDAEARPLFLSAMQVRPDYAEAVVQLADLDLKDHRPADAYKRVTDYLKVNLPTPDVLLFGWRAARDLKDPVGAAQMAWRMQSDFPDSEQAKALAQMSGARN
jgi:type IV pilus assembly protein PilF